MPGIDLVGSSAGQTATYAALITFSLRAAGSSSSSLTSELEQAVPLGPLKIKGVRKGRAVLLGNS